MNKQRERLYPTVFYQHRNEDARVIGVNLFEARVKATSKLYEGENPSFNNFSFTKKKKKKKKKVHL